MLQAEQAFSIRKYPVSQVVQTVALVQVWQLEEQATQLPPDTKKKLVQAVQAGVASQVVQLAWIDEQITQVPALR